MKRILKFFLVLGVIFGLACFVFGGAAGLYVYIRFTRDLPKIEKLSDYRPKAVTSMYSSDGRLVAEFFDERRYPVAFNQIPKLVKNAFLAAEDANFYRHPGIDLTSIARAMYKNWKHKSNVQGASTITQQIVKSLVLTREKTYERKVKEAILSYRLEKALSKDEIYSIYLNEIFLGSTAYGVKAAARVHFHKELDQLSIAQAAFLAGLPQKPSALSEPGKRRDAIGRQHYVLDQMERNGMITAEEHRAALAEPLTIYPPDNRRFYEAPFFMGHAKLVLEEKLKEIDPNWTPTNPGGFEVYTTLDLKADELAERSLQRALKELDKRRGWRGVLKNDEQALKLQEADISARGIEPGRIYRAVVLEVRPKTNSLLVQLGGSQYQVDLKDAGWAKRLLDKEDRVTGIDLLSYLKRGNTIEVSKPFPQTQPTAPKDTKAKEQNGAASAEDKLSFDQTPDIEGAFVLANALSGEIKTVIGGYDYQRSQFNRATQGLRQPGSSFKPFIYLAALEHLSYTPSTIVPDSPISLVAGNGQLWTPGNFDHKFLGPITLRTALQRSRNVVSVFLLDKLGIQRGIDSARALGISTPIGKDLSISLGTSEVKLIEMVRAYGAFAAGGYLADPLVITKIVDRDGAEVARYRPRAKKAIDPESAFIMASMMKGVVERGTATILKQLNRPVAGKTGTTNDQMDAWFIGYTPEWAAGVWVGFDQKKSIGRLETGGKAAAPVFLYFMQEFLADTPAFDFDPPNGVVPVPVDVNTGHPLGSAGGGAFIEYFKSGTEPHAVSAETSAPQEYLQSDEF